MQLDFLCGAVADEDAVFPADIADNRLVKLVAADLDRFAGDDVVQRNQRDIRCAAADVHDQIAVWHGNINIRSNGCRHGLFNQIGFACARLVGGVHNCALLNFGDGTGYANHHARANQHVPAGLGEKVPQHLQRHIIAADDAVAQRAYHINVLRRPPEHLLRFSADADDPLGHLVNRHDRGFLEDDSPPLYIYQYRCRTEVYCNIPTHRTSFRYIILQSYSLIIYYLAGKINHFCVYSCDKFAQG